MPIPETTEGIEREVDSLYDMLKARMAEDMAIGFAGRLQAASVRRLVLALDEGSREQRTANARMLFVGWVGIVLTIVVVGLTAVQALAAWRSMYP